MRRTAALIVGGGPAGSAAAIVLAQGGVMAELIERSSGPHETVCGGFLGWDALAALRRLGLDADALGARPIARLRLVSRRRTIETRLPKVAAGLSRRRLDEVLLERAQTLGARVRRGKAVRGLENAVVRLDDGEQIAADALFLATGKHELRGAERPREVTRAGAVGLRTVLPPEPGRDAALRGVIELHLFEGGYAGLLLQEDGRTNLCLTIGSDRLRRAGGVSGLIEELCGKAPLLAARIGAIGAQAWDAVSGVPYGWRARATLPGLFRVGDQASVIASLAGDGIAIALASGMAAAETLLSGGTATDFQPRWARRAARPLRVAELLRAVASRDRLRCFLFPIMQRAPAITRLASRLTRVG